MCSFKKAREDIVLAYSYIDDEEFVVLHDIVCRGKSPELPFKDYDSFSSAETDAVECNVNFRFQKNEIPVLARAMDIPEEPFATELKDCVFFYGDFATLVDTAT